MFHLYRSKDRIPILLCRSILDPYLFLYSEPLDLPRDGGEEDDRRGEREEVRRRRNVLRGYS